MAPGPAVPLGLPTTPQPVPRSLALGSQPTVPRTQGSYRERPPRPLASRPVLSDHTITERLRSE